MTHYEYACNYDGERVPCWLAQFTDTDCQGRMDRIHLVPKQVLKRAGIEDVWDERWWQPGCRWHHGQFDNYRLVVPRPALPWQVEHFAATHGLTWYMERRYGPVEAAA